MNQFIQKSKAVLSASDHIGLIEQRLILLAILVTKEWGKK